MPIETVAVVGGAGFLGRAVLTDLADAGHRAVAIDRDGVAVPAADEVLVADALDADAVYDALDAAAADAVVHVGTVPNPMGRPGHETFRSNADTTYNVLDAAADLDLQSAAVASSINALGWAYGADPPAIEYVPIDEAHPARPADPYAIGKRTVEVIADGFGRMSDLTVTTLRYPWVASEADLRDCVVEADRSLSGLREEWDTEGPTNDCFSYVHLADAASTARHAVEADFAGHETVFVAAADTNAAVPTERLLDEFHPDVERRRAFEGHESLVDCSKANGLLGWSPEHSWRDLA